MRCAEHLQRLLATALPLRDVLEERVDTARVPTWCATRGWTDFLLRLPEDALRAAEAHGLWFVLSELCAAPPSLVELARDVAVSTRLPTLAGTTPLDAEACRSVRLRKRAQLSALLAAVSVMARDAARIVDVGSGSGHFTRLSAELFERDAVGLEHNPERVESARRRSRSSDRASFVGVDARGAVRFTERDLAIGLHACGELGDELVAAAARAGCDLALVSCCLQKISGRERRPLSTAGGEASFKREYLGLTNLTPQPEGVEAGIEATLAARQTRYALGRLLRARGVTLEPGAEMSGINRRQASGGLARVAALATALRGLPQPSSAEIAEHEAASEREYGVIRRLSLPRNLLARLLEVLVALDRATHLEEQGSTALVVTLFETRVSPRNIAIFASRAPERLPAATGATPC